MFAGLKSTLRHIKNKQIWLIGLVYALITLLMPLQAAHAQTLPTIRVNTGGKAYTDNLGRVWAADHSYFGGVANSTTSPIAGTSNASLYQTERWNNAPRGENVSYAFAVPAGDYQIRLHFAEIYPWAFRDGGRVFDVGIENKTVLYEFDVYSQVGGNKSLVKSFGAAIVDGTLNIRLTNGTAGNATIAAIEIIGETPQVIKVNAGGGAYTDSHGHKWLADRNYNTGVPNTTTAAIGSTSSDPLYQNERVDITKDVTPLEYKFNLSNDIYKVKLHFAEIYPWAFRDGGRVFDVGIEGTTVLDDFDIYKTAGGGNKAVVKEFMTTVTDGNLKINFAHGSANNPTVAAIEVIKQQSSDSLPEYYIAGPGQKVNMMVVGDSYTAGNGAGVGGTLDHNFFKSVDDPRLDSQVRQKIDPQDSSSSRGCYRHPNAWGEHAFRKTRTLYGNTGSFINTACSGDITTNIYGNPENPPQLNGFDAARRKSIDVISLTIGGNDLGFVPLITNCFVITNNGNACNAEVTRAESMLVPHGGYSAIQYLVYAALDKLKTDYPNAKIVLVGYPMIWEDRGMQTPCSNCAPGIIEPGKRLETGLNTLNAQYQQLVDDFNARHPGRFAFLPLHDANNQGFYDGHGLRGAKTPWMHPVGEGAYSSWFHPNADGYAAIGDQLSQMPIVKNLFK